MPIELTTDPPDGIHQQRLDVHLTHPRRPLEPPAAVGGADAEARVPPFDAIALDLARWWDFGG
jgi:hypothetical protein